MSLQKTKLIIRNLSNQRIKSCLHVAREFRNNVVLINNTDAWDFRSIHYLDNFRRSVFSVLTQS